MAWKANGIANLPLADRERAWDADSAEARVRRWAGGDENMDWPKYRKAFFAYDDERSEEFGGYKLQFADVIDGELRAVPRGVMAVAAVLQGSRGGVDLPEAVQNEIKSRVEAYYKKMGMEAPWARSVEASALREGRMLESTALPAEERRAILLDLHMVRAVAPNRVGGYAVVWGGRDLYNTTFTPETDFWLDRYPRPPLLYDHGFDATIGARAVGHVEGYRQDDVGLWFEAQLELHEEYREAVGELLKRGALGFSSGSVQHLVEIGADGVIKRWPIVEISLTPTPAEPRTLDWHIVKDYPLEANFRSAIEAASTDRRPTELSENKQQLSEVKQGDNEMADEVKEVKTEAEPDGKAKEEAKSEGQKVLAPAGLFAVKKVTARGFSDDALRSWVHWLRTGDEVAVRAALQEGTASEGGYLVPDDFYARVVAKLSEQSIARAMGAVVIPTSRDIIRVPTEGTSMDKFAVTAEEAAYEENEPTFGELALTIYKFTKLVKVSEELLEDEAVQPRLPDLLAAMFARAMAETENYYFLIGTGSSQPQGAVTGGTLGVTAASASAIAAGEVVDLYFSLPSQYRVRPSVCWAADDSTEKVIRKLQATSSAGEFLFQVTPGGALEPDTLLGKRMWNSASMPDIAASAKVLLFGDWEYYVIAERASLVVDRNPYLYQANGQVGLFAKFRVGGGVAQAAAFRYLAMAAS